MGDITNKEKRRFLGLLVDAKRGKLHRSDEKELIRLAELIGGKAPSEVEKALGKPSKKTSKVKKAVKRVIKSDNKE
tara:strand:- start:2045 stop:2272 length:228 start_codon:yes stop_codon:yes gene_type:complete